MYLKTDRLIARIGGIVLATGKSFGTKYLLDETAVVGLDDGADIRRASTQRQLRDGDFREPGFYGSRLISFSGIAVGDTIADYYLMRDNFQAAVAVDRFVQLSVENSYGTRYIDVSLASKPSWVRTTDKTATFKLDLYAPDPTFYGVTKRFQLPGKPKMGGLDFPIDYPINYGVSASDQAIYVTNAGNVRTWPSFIITGDYTAGFSITDNLGNFITYSGPVSMQAPVTLDSLTGSARQGRQDRSTLITKRDWFSIPPGSVLQATFLPNESVLGWCDILFKDTWI